MHKILLLLVMLLAGCNAGTTVVLEGVQEPSVESATNDEELLYNLKIQAAAYYAEPRLAYVYQYFGDAGSVDDGYGNILKAYGTTYWYYPNTPVIVYDNILAGWDCGIIYVGSHELVHGVQILQDRKWDFSLPYMEQLHEIEAYAQGALFARWFANSNGYTCEL